MDEDTAIINSNTQNEKIKNFFINNKKSLFLILSLIIILLIGYFGLLEYKEKEKTQLIKLKRKMMIFVIPKTHLMKKRAN